VFFCLSEAATATTATTAPPHPGKPPKPKWWKPKPKPLWKSPNPPEACALVAANGPDANRAITAAIAMMLKAIPVF